MRKRGKPQNVERREAILRRLKKGKSLSQIVRELDIDPRLVSYYKQQLSRFILDSDNKGE